MVTYKGASNNSPRPKDTMSDSSPYNDFDSYGLSIQSLQTLARIRYQRRGTLNVKEEKA